MKERTLSIIKPDGVLKDLIGTVINRLEKEGLKIAAGDRRRTIRRQVNLPDKSPDGKDRRSGQDRRKTGI